MAVKQPKKKWHKKHHLQTAGSWHRLMAQTHSTRSTIYRLQTLNPVLGEKLSIVAIISLNRVRINL